MIGKPNSTGVYPCHRQGYCTITKEHPEFRVRTPLLSSSPITAHIGIREDVTEDSRFEVLEVGETSDGRTTYKRVAVIKPKKVRFGIIDIWLSSKNIKMVF